MTTLLLFWQKRTVLEKLFLIIIVVGVIYASVVTIQKGVYKYRYFKEVEQNYTKARDSIIVLNETIKYLNTKQENRTKNVQKKSTTINDKLKQDETIIDNSNPDDDELNAYISKHENG
ncbi:hypothetical protein [Winogradskyella pulchriflava]|uniref:Uncharacterized protein n=1 Tax=Winogradskyella pulchriflava TaxID=1110688 RepID=A0ABV6QEU3_9FLAO